jgi:glycosyltransferase involved in cell wall biosynthesis
MNRPPVLFFHCVDADNLNAQSNNTKAILAHWDAEDLPAAAFYFGDPDPAVAGNPNVHLLKLPANRLWKARALVAALGNFSGVCYPGFAVALDSLVLRLRSALGLGGAVISTLEGLPASSHERAAKEARLAELAGHPVHCQRVSPPEMAAIDKVKSHSNLIIAISPFLECMADCIWPEPSKGCIPLGVNLELFHHRNRSPHGENRRVQVVCAGNFHRQKRPEMFVQLAGRHPESDFTWFGDGPLRESLLEQARLDGLKNLFFPGPVVAESLAAAFREADIFTLPSVAEGVPKVTQEAAACGLPIVCMHYFEPISVQHGANGFQARNDADYTKHVATLIRHAEMRARMGAVSAEMAQTWDWSRLAPRWQASIRDMVLETEPVRRAS